MRFQYARRSDNTGEVSALRLLVDKRASANAPRQDQIAIRRHKRVDTVDTIVPEVDELKNDSLGCACMHDIRTARLWHYSLSCHSFSSPAGTMPAFSMHQAASCAAVGAIVAG